MGTVPGERPNSCWCVPVIARAAVTNSPEATVDVCRTRVSLRTSMRREDPQAVHDAHTKDIYTSWGGPWFLATLIPTSIIAAVIVLLIVQPGGEANPHALQEAIAKGVDGAAEEQVSLFEYNLLFERGKLPLSDEELREIEEASAEEAENTTDGHG